MKRSVEVKIMDQSYILKTEVDEEYAKKIADYLDGKIREIMQGGKIMNVQNAVVLAALNIVDEYFKCREAVENINKIVEGKSRELLKELDEIKVDEVPLRFA